jgi:hypothetical protein
MAVANDTSATIEENQQAERPAHAMETTPQKDPDGGK